MKDLNLKFLLTSLCTLTLIACGSNPSKNPEGRFIVESIADSNTLADHTPWIEFKDGNMQGHAGCNRFFSKYKIHDGQIAFGPIGSTRKLCPGGEMEQEDALIKLLTTTLNFQSTDNQGFIFFLESKPVITVSPENINTTE